MESGETALPLWCRGDVVDGQHVAVVVANGIELSIPVAPGCEADAAEMLGEMVFQAEFPDMRDIRVRRTQLNVDPDAPPPTAREEQAWGRLRELSRDDPGPLITHAPRRLMNNRTTLTPIRGGVG